jgi:hypothetical protein
VALVQHIRYFVEHWVNVLSAIVSRLVNFKWGKLLLVGVLTTYLMVWAFLTVDNDGSIGGLDPSWEMGLTAALKQGELSGRDTLFTYGPLYQLIAYAGSRINVQNSPFDGNISARIVIVEISILLFSLCILLMKPISGLQTLIIYFGIAVTGMLQPMSIRVMIGLLAILVFYKSLTSLNWRVQLLTASFAGGLAFIAQTLSFDAGIYSIISIILLSILFLFASRLHSVISGSYDKKVWPYIEKLGLAIGVYLLANLFISVLFVITSNQYPRFLSYQLQSLELMAIFSRTLGLPLVLGVWGTLAWFALVIVTILMTIIRMKSSWSTEGQLFACLLVYSLIMLKSAITRADTPHLIHGTFPILLTFLALGQPKMSRRKLVLWAVVFTVFASGWTGRNLSPIQFGLDVLKGKYTIAQRWYELRQDHHFQLTPLASKMLTRYPDRLLLAYPYQNFIPIIAGRPMVAPILQSYAASSDHLQEQYIAALEQESAGFDVIFGIDKLASWEVDGVQSITRTPLIFEYLYSNFRLADPNNSADGFLLLEPRTDSKVFKGSPLSFITSKDKDNVTILLSQPAQCSLLKLTIQITYPFWILLGHASPIHMEIYSMSEMVASTNAVDLNNNEPFYTYINLLSPTDFPQVFSPTEVTRIPLDRLVISDIDGGIFGFRPTSVKVYGIECIRPGDSD